MKKVISFCLWGNNPTYTIGAIKNAELAKEIYPDWTCRYYIGTSTSTEIIDKLKSFDNTEVIIMKEEGDWTGMFWRFYAASDDMVDVVIVRDCDSRLNQREKAAVDEWLESDRGFHIMRDHPYHGTEILGGMWGAKRGTISNIKPMIDEYNKSSFIGVDQNFLREHIYPIVCDNSLIHDEFFIYESDNYQYLKNFPTPRQPRRFVGQAFNQFDEELYTEHADFFN